MRAFEDFDPIALTVYFFTVAGAVMFCMDPVVSAISLAGALLLYLVRNGTRGLRSHLYFLGMFAAIALLNPLISHNGATVLFVINDSPITLESLIYGVVSATVITAVIYWFRTFSQIMTSDRLLYVFGSLSPKLALVLSMTIRSVKLFTRQWRVTAQTQRALGLYKDDNVIDSLRGGLRVFSIVVTWALENGITTADSMTARGYGTGRRTNFHRFRFRAADVTLMSVSVGLFTAVCVSLACGALHTDFYPHISMSENSVMTSIGRISYAILVLMPTVIKAEEAIKWKYFMSRV